MKRNSIVIILIGVAITVFCIIHFRPALDVVDSDTMTVGGSSSAKTSEWPLFVGILTTFVGIVFYFVSTHDRTAKK